MLTYYLPKAPRQATIEIFDSKGRLVRRLQGDDVPKKSGINRLAWDLSEDGPAKWNGTFKENQGPDEGAEVVPGSFTVRLITDGTTTQQTLAVKFDPRDPSLAQAQSRYDFLSPLFAELGSVDAMLNRIDARLQDCDAK